MTSSSIIGMINNAALLLALCLLYDMLGFQSKSRTSDTQKALAGIALGAIGIAIMRNPWDFGQGVFFDTRSVLLCVSGYFFGSVPTLLAVLMTTGLRLIMGGSGMWTGVAVIVTSGGIGLAWRYFRDSDRGEPSTIAFFLLGLAVHAVTKQFKCL